MLVLKSKHRITDECKQKSSEMLKRFAVYRMKKQLRCGLRFKCDIYVKIPKSIQTTYLFTLYCVCCTPVLVNHANDDVAERFPLFVIDGYLKLLYIVVQRHF